MAITIQELIASDTISQVVDKINFNFDQLLLNGGGPIGPAGPIGPPGPIGGRGERGTEWYEGTDDPNVTPPTLSPLTADYYLQANGDVWEYTGLTWSNTGINLRGPQGAQGISVGWSQFGNSPYPTYAANFQNVLYPSPITSGITVSNQGVASTLIGAVGPNDVSANPGIPFTPAYQLNTTMAGSIDSSIVSMLVHQKDSSSQAIKFMGGGAIAGDNFEQSSISLLSSISLGVDDSLIVNVPKAITGAPGSVSDTYGFNIYTLEKAQRYRSGRSISFTTGTIGNTLTGPYDISDFTIELNAVNNSQLPKFEVIAVGSESASLTVGNVSLPTTTIDTGSISLTAGDIGLLAEGLIRISSLANEWVFPNLQNTTISPVGLVSIDSSGRLGTITDSSSGFPTGQLSWDGSNLDGSQGVDTRVVRWDGNNKIESSAWEIKDTGELLPITLASTPNIGSSTNRLEKIFFGKTNRSDISSEFLGGTEFLNIFNNYQSKGIQINGNGTFIGTYTGVTNKASMQYADSSLQISSNLQSGSYKAGQIEFKQSGGNSPSVEGPMIIGPIATSLTDGPTQGNTLTIKGGSGFTLANNFTNGGRGRSIVISGGDARANQSGGTVFIGGGEHGPSTGPTFNGNVWIGRNPYATSGSETSPSIKFGETGSDSGYITVIQPSDTNLYTAGENYIASFVKNSSTANAKGRLQLRDLDGTSQLNFGVNVTTSAFSSNAFYTRLGDSLISAESDINGDEGGLAIIYQNKKGGIRLDGQNQKVMIMGNTNQSLTQTAIDTNANGQYDSTVGVYMEGDIHISTNNNIITAVDKDRYIMLSGNYEGDDVVSGQPITELEMNWTRVGRIVTVHFYLVHTSASGDRVLPFPINSSGNSGTPTNVFGSGTAYNFSGSLTKPLFVDLSGNGWKLNDQTAGGYSDPNGKAMGSFSYELL